MFLSVLNLGDVTASFLALEDREKRGGLETQLLPHI